MCGILGAFGSSLPDRQQFSAALSTLTHRGPDGSGIFAAATCLLGHRRLSIIDVSGGTQPMHSADGRYSIIYNGELYNYKELRKEVEHRYRFVTQSDTEVLLALFILEGPAMLARLNGMYAFAVADHEQGELFCARDPLGIKPFVYARRGTTLLFASEIKALRALGCGQIDEQAVPYFFACKFIAAPHTIYADIQKLPAGHFMRARMDNGALSLDKPVRFFEPRVPQDELLNVPPDPVQVRHWIEEAVRAHLVSDVPVGAFLSGGLDSSAIVWAMSLQGRPKTFTVGFSEFPDDPDVYHARMVAKHFNTEHTEIMLDLDVGDDYAAVLEQFDEPFADPAAVTNWYVARAVAAQVKVALSGDGGDELFFGYPSYARAARFEYLLRCMPQRMASAALARVYFGFNRRMLGRILRLPIPAVPLRAFPYRDMKQRARMQDITVTLPDYYLRKVDGVSMKESLEVRVPFLSLPLVRSILPLGSAAHYDKRGGKALLRAAMEPVLPRAVLERPKQGFARPWNSMFAGPLRHALRSRVLSAPMRECGWFAMDTVEHLLLDHEQGRADNGGILWRLFVFAHWLERQ